jgi:hypothetical protein
MTCRTYKTPATGAPKPFNLMIEEIGETVKNYITRQTTLVGHPEIELIRNTLEEVHEARRVGKLCRKISQSEVSNPAMSFRSPCLRGGPSQDGFA